MGLFCKHIWKDGKSEYLRTVMKDCSSYYSIFPIWRTYAVYAYTQTCIKCGKKIVKEHFILQIQDGWCNGSTTDFESVSGGSNPSLSACGFQSIFPKRARIKNGHIRVQLSSVECLVWGEDVAGSSPATLTIMR